MACVLSSHSLLNKHLRLEPSRKEQSLWDFFLAFCRILSIHIMPYDRIKERIYKVVRVVGLEPTLLSEPDFESGASTSSTTPAYCYKRQTCRLSLCTI